MLHAIRNGEPTEAVPRLGSAPPSSNTRARSGWLVRHSVMQGRPPYVIGPVRISAALEQLLGKRAQLIRLSCSMMGQTSQGRFAMRIRVSLCSGPRPPRAADQGISRSAGACRGRGSHNRGGSPRFGSAPAPKSRATLPAGQSHEMAVLSAVWFPALMSAPHSSNALQHASTASDKSLDRLKAAPEKRFQRRCPQAVAGFDVRARSYKKTTASLVGNTPWRVDKLVDQRPSHLR